MLPRNPHKVQPMTEELNLCEAALKLASGWWDCGGDQWVPINDIPGHATMPLAAKACYAFADFIGDYPSESRRWIIDIANSEVQELLQNVDPHSPHLMALLKAWKVRHGR